MREIMGRLSGKEMSDCSRSQWLEVAQVSYVKA